MFLKFCNFLLILLSFHAIISAQRHQTTELPHIFQSEELPVELKYMPTIGNGHCSFTIFGDTIYCNGVYNGKNGISHRARIPNYSNIKIDYKNISLSPDDAWRIEYSLIVRSGIFQIRLENKDMRIVQVIYAHRYYNRIIVNEIFVSRIRAKGDISLNISQEPGNEKSEDFDFDPIQYLNKDELSRSYRSTSGRFGAETDVYLQLEGLTKIAEDITYQKSMRHICSVWNAVPDKLIVKEGDRFKSFKFLMAIDEKCSIAKKEIFDALKEKSYLLKMHQNQWRKIWNEFNIEVKGDMKLSRAIQGSLFYLVCALPSLETNQPNNLYFGLSPTGLGRGGDNLIDYRGHNFWDTEIWMFPIVLQMNPKWARQLIGYRYRMLSTAMDYANSTGYKGARFPWESAYTGREVTDPCCLIVAYQQHHITADISLSHQLYLSTTHDQNWLLAEGCNLTQNIARFWESRVQKNDSTGLFEIKYVMGPDEDHDNVTNNVYTNVVAGYALRFAHFASSVCGNEDSIESERWFHIANNLYIPYDKERDYHPQFEGYKIGTSIKQADAVLLSYPLQYQMNDSTRKNNLKIYEAVTRPTGPAMTWAIFGIGHLDNRECEKAEKFLNKSYQQNVMEPFQVWKETIDGGASNFITGAGGFLQLIFNGYAGWRFFLDRCEISQPCYTPNVEKLLISGIKYLGSRFKMTITKTESLLLCTYLNKEFPLILIQQNQSIVQIVKGTTYKINTKVVLKSMKNNYKDWR